jgi:hypothetical protein
MVEADPVVFDSESNGVCLTCRWKGSFTVYQKRMNASGKIDVKANGDPAIEGIASQDPLAH